MHIPPPHTHTYVYVVLIIYILPFAAMQVGGVLPGGLTLRGLSGGERRRVSIAVGILAAPSIVFLDGARQGWRGRLVYGWSGRVVGVPGAAVAH